MTIARHAGILFAALLFPFSLLSSQQPSAPAAQPASHNIQLDVVVTNKAGQIVPNLQQGNFTVLDNKSSAPISSFRVMTPQQEPVRVILFLDTVNTPYSLMAWSRDRIEKYLQSNEGVLPYPTNIAILTDTGAQINNAFSTDGRALSDQLAKTQIGLREINRDSAWGGIERFQICITAFEQLVRYASTLPGRKIVLWISPGWPLVSGPYVELDVKQEQKIFNEVVGLSTLMRQSNLTLYNLNPVGSGQSLASADYYETFVKGIAKPQEAQLGDLSVQVMAVQSGGLALESDSDVTAQIQKCVADAASWYRITLDPPASEKANEYHHIAIKVNQPGLTARTRDGYYANPRVEDTAR